MNGPGVPRPSTSGRPDSDPDYTDEVIANNETSQTSGDAPRRKRAEKTVEITDPKAIRALAHAARIEVISELYATQVSHTATELAARTGLTPSAMSYHLRALQKWGIVAPAENSGDARERRWKAAGTDFTISGGSVASPEIAVVDLELDAFRRRASAFAKARGERRQRGKRGGARSRGPLKQPAVPDQPAEERACGQDPGGCAGVRTRGSHPDSRGCAANGNLVVNDP